MNSSMRILYLEDNPADVELSRAVLEKDGLKYEMTVVDTREDYVAALEAGGYDLILADYHLPSFDGMEALEIAREKYSWLPFIFVSGMIGEEIATESLKRGATDYVLKERLARLPGSMRRALVEAGERRRLKKAEAEREKLLEELSVQHHQLTEVLRRMPAGVIIAEAPSCKLIMGNGQMAQIWRQEIPPTVNLEEFKAGRGFHPDGRTYQLQEWPLSRSITAGEMVTNEEVEILRGDGTRGAVSINSAPIRDGEGRIVAGVVTFFDITERKQVERKLREQAEMLDLAHDAIFAWELDGAISYWNRAAEEIYGYAQEEAVGRVSHELLETEAVEDMHALLDSLRLSGRWQGELCHRTKDGREIVVESRMTLVKRNGHRLVLETNRDITERKRAEQERERLLESENAARREAEHANQAKDEFLALLSHELRTPLTPMLGWIRILRRRQVRPEDHDSALEKIERSVESEIKLVSDLLDVSRIITGKMTLNLQTLDFSGIVSAAVEVARSLAEAKEIELVVETGEREALVSGDPDRLQQVVLNLVSNAIKFTPPGGRVEARLRRDGAQLELIVKDTGQGISPEFLPHVFERFRQADSSVARAHGGLGLGLSITKRLVELHQGSIRAVSQGEGRGSTFTVKLPLAVNPGAPSASSRQIYSGDYRAREFGAVSLEGARILMVDDDANTRDMMKVMLEQVGADVVTAASASEALSKLQPGRYDAMLADIGMAEVNGYELIARVRALGPEKGGDLPAIAITAFAGKEDRLRAITSGFQYHMSKPVEPGELVGAIAALIWSGE
ncbi:MAG TPA: response regulator [Blastocatellia bacterium]|nr:response regulator [Blastocatellia bacterium]